MFIIKKILSRFLFPLSLVIILLFIGAAFKKGKRTLLFTGIALLYLFSFSPFAYLILHPLEGRYAPLSAAALQKDIRWVVVLGRGYGGDETMTTEDRLSDSSLKRVMEGVRLARLLPKSQLILSEGSYLGKEPGASLMSQAALHQGLPPERIVMESNSWDTQDQAQILRQRLGHAPFYLVTSAAHMTRAMKMFQRLGSRPIAAPADFRVSWAFPTIIEFFPQAEALSNTETAFYEYLGLLWGALRGYI